MNIIKKQYILLIQISSILIIALLLFSAQPTKSQNLFKYWIELSDKNNSDYSISNPSEFLSQRAIQRRVNQNIDITESDLPVNNTYVQQIQDQGVNIVYTSKWFNALVIEIDDESILSTISKLPFVKDIVHAASYLIPKKSNQKFKLESEHSTLLNISDDKYGYAFEQINLHNGDWLHNNGFRGEGIHVAVLDAGFSNANNLSAFDSLWLSNRILGYKDFVDPNDKNAIFVSHSHGTNVLSIIGTNRPNEYIGTAPGASYWMIRTEDGASEMRIEEMNWIAAIEFADSAGVDVVNTSLGYSEFDIPSHNYEYDDMTGKIAYISRAAEIAASKGMLLVTSAGNSGNDPWQYITAPADADNILTIGAINVDEEIAPFSSQGPTFDGRTKPDIVSVGYLTALVNTNGNYVAGNGTSFSAPMVTGLVSCLWQAFPNATNNEIIDAVRFSSDRYNHPDGQFGYGIPDFKIAYEYLSSQYVEPESFTVNLKSTNWGTFVEVKLLEQSDEPLKFNVYDINGRVISSEEKMTANNTCLYPLDMLETSPVGIYFVKVKNSTGEGTVKVIR